MRETQYKTKGNKDHLPLRDLLTAKISVRSKLNDEIKVLRTQNDDKKVAIEELVFYLFKINFYLCLLVSFLFVHVLLNFPLS